MKILKIEASGSELLSFIGYVKEKDAEKTIKRIRADYLLLLGRHGDTGTPVN